MKDYGKIYNKRLQWKALAETIRGNTEGLRCWMLGRLEPIV